MPDDRQRSFPEDDAPQPADDKTVQLFVGGGMVALTAVVLLYLGLSKDPGTDPIPIAPLPTATTSAAPVVAPPAQTSSADRPRPRADPTARASGAASAPAASPSTTATSGAGTAPTSATPTTPPADPPSEGN